MKHDMSVDGEAMSTVEGNDVTHLMGMPVGIDVPPDQQLAAFYSYREAFNLNASEPNLRHATELVLAWNTLAEAVGLVQS